MHRFQPFHSSDEKKSEPICRQAVAAPAGSRVAGVAGLELSNSIESDDEQTDSCASRFHQGF
jgi:hypothetical protein